LSDPRRSGGNNCLSTGNVQELEEEPGEVFDNPLHNTKVVHHLNKRNEEDDG